MKLIIAGGRHQHLDNLDCLNLCKIEGVSKVVSGGATGIDLDGESWGHSRKLPVMRFFADWKSHGKAAGPIRNKSMAEYADALAVFNGGRGTDNMVKTAQKLGLKIYDFRDNK